MPWHWLSSMRSGRADKVNETNEMVDAWRPPADSRRVSDWPRPEDLVEHPLACAVCGVSTPYADAAGHVEIWRGWRGMFHPARVCRPCWALADPTSSATPAAAVAGLIEADDIAMRAVAAWVPWFSQQPDTTPWLPGTAERWEHVDRGELARVVADFHARFGVRRSPNGTGCGGCGVAEAAGWGRVIYAPSGARHYACGSCGDVLDVVGAGYALAERLAVEAAQLTRQPCHRFAELIGFRLYADAVPGGPGTAEAFGFLGADLVRLRILVRQRWPELVVGADAAAIAEERLRARREAAAAAGGLRLDGVL